MSLGRSAFTFKAGDWTDVGIHVQVNDLGQSNGFIQLFVNGDRVLSYPSITFRASTVKADQLLVEDVMFSTFFGGHTELYASPQDTFTQFKDMSLSVSDTVTSSSNRVECQWFLLWTVLVVYFFAV
jgi:hypothetical protein